MFTTKERLRRAQKVSGVEPFKVILQGLRQFDWPSRWGWATTLIIPSSNGSEAQILLIDEQKTSRRLPEKGLWEFCGALRFEEFDKAYRAAGCQWKMP